MNAVHPQPMIKVLWNLFWGILKCCVTICANEGCETCRRTTSRDEMYIYCPATQKPEPALGTLVQQSTWNFWSVATSIAPPDALDSLVKCSGTYQWAPIPEWFDTSYLLYSSRTRTRTNRGTNTIFKSFKRARVVVLVQAHMEHWID